MATVITKQPRKKNTFIAVQVSIYKAIKVSWKPRDQRHCILFNRPANTLYWENENRSSHVMFQTLRIDSKISEMNRSDDGNSFSSFLYTFSLSTSFQRLKSCLPQIHPTHPILLILKVETLSWKMTIFLFDTVTPSKSFMTSNSTSWTTSNLQKTMYLVH